MSLLDAKSDMPAFGLAKRKEIRQSIQVPVSESMLDPAKGFPILYQAEVEGLNLAAWAASQRGVIEEQLLKFGAVLFRGFDVNALTQFEDFTHIFSSTLLDYFDQHTPRSRVSGQIYTSTEYPADHIVPFHSENSKNHTWPLKIWFCCLHPAQSGGETPIADNRRVLALLDEKIRNRFIEKKVMYVRNFGEGLGVSWQTAFQTTDPSVVEQKCRQANMEWEWKDANRLRVRHRSQSVLQHQSTGDIVWFNQAHLFHITNLETTAREAMLALFKEEDLPSNSYYGDGSPIEESVLDEIRSAFLESSVTFPWKKGDVLMLDNVRISHARNPFTGQRKVVVAMAELSSDIHSI